MSLINKIEKVSIKANKKTDMKPNSQKKKMIKRLKREMIGDLKNIKNLKIN